MEIQHKEDNNGGLFYIAGEHNYHVGEMVYSKMDDHVILITHTEVNDSLKGKGAGSQLVAKAVMYARDHNLKIIPKCSFAKAIFEKKVEYQDVLYR